jgi:hypothetical protein
MIILASHTSITDTFQEISTRCFCYLLNGRSSGWTIRPSKMLRQATGFNEELFVTFPSMEKLTKAAAATTVLEIMTEDGSTQANAFITTFHLFNMTMLAAGPTLAMRPQIIDAYVTKEQFAFVASAQHVAEIATIEELFLLVVSCMKILAITARASPI